MAHIDSILQQTRRLQHEYLQSVDINSVLDVGLSFKELEFILAGAEVKKAMYDQSLHTLEHAVGTFRGPPKKVFKLHTVLQSFK